MTNTARHLKVYKRAADRWIVKVPQDSDDKALGVFETKEEAYDFRDGLREFEACQ